MWKAGVTAALCGFIATAAHGQGQQCAPRANVIEHLADQFEQARQSVGLSPDGQAMIETFANSETGTWTILVSLPNGMSCLIADGIGWEAVDEKPQGATF